MKLFNCNVRSATGVFLSWIFLTSLLLITPVHLSGEHRALKKYKQQDYEGALQEFDRIIKKYPELEEAHFGKGVTLYRQQKYQEAMEEFEKSLSIDDPRKKARVFYNLGNALVQNQRLNEALEFYKKSLQLDPSDYDSKYNLEVVKRLLQQQQQQQPQQQQQNSQDSSRNQDKQEQNNTQQKEQSQQEKEKSQPQTDDQKEQSAMNQQQETQQQDKKNQQQDKSRAARMLNALKSEEKELMKEYIKSRMSGVKLEKDW